MIDFVLRRLLMAIPTLWVTLTVIFLLVRVIPGDPTAIIMGSYLSEENVKTLKRQMGLDRPMAVQYVDYLSRFCQFDFFLGGFFLFSSICFLILSSLISFLTIHI